MTSNDTANEDKRSNSEPSAALKERFNRDNEFAKQFMEASPEAQQEVKKLEALKQSRLENERASQERARSYREMKEKVQLLENYIKDQSDRPAEIRADPSPDLKIIDEQAKRTVQDRETFFLKTIEREADANIREVLRQDREGAPNQNRERDREH